MGLIAHRWLCSGLLLLGSMVGSALAADPGSRQNDIRLDALTSSSGVQHGLKRPNFKLEAASAQVRLVADWVVDSGDNSKLPFVIVDKAGAKAFVFRADGQLRGAAPVLLGLAVGDDSVPGIGERKLSSILPEERTTPAGRFVATLDHNLRGKRILWVDYEAGISLHPVITTNPDERRAQRLATPTLLDKRISYGCINVPAKFFYGVVAPAFKGTNGIVYVLPETRSVQQVFAMGLSPRSK